MEDMSCQQRAHPVLLFFRPLLQDYFRPVAQEDILALMPYAAAEPLQDDALLVPLLGKEPQAAPAPAGGMRAAGRMLARQMGDGDDASEVGPSLIRPLAVSTSKHHGL